MISLWHSNINEELSVSPCFLNIQTLILRNNGMKSFPIGFFQFMLVIRVLDLKGNRKLVELPLEICRLKSLEYLNLAWMSIKKVPIELKNLIELRCLILNHVRRIEVIPLNMISCLSNLHMFSMILYTTWDIKEYEEGHILSTGFIVVLQELECLQYLSEISISLHIVPTVKNFSPP